jgi:hypothetical protein
VGTDFYGGGAFSILRLGNLAILVRRVFRLVPLLVKNPMLDCANREQQKVPGAALTYKVGSVVVDAAVKPDGLGLLSSMPFLAESAYRQNLVQQAREDQRETGIRTGEGDSRRM